MELNKRVAAFDKLGQALRTTFGNGNTIFSSDEQQLLEKLKTEVAHARLYNAWFTEDFVKYALLSLGESLKRENLDRWLAKYDFPNTREKTVGVVMAGNVPVVGFHDFLSVLVSGHHLQAKLSSDDNRLLPALANLVVAFEPAFADVINFTEERLHDFDAIIATGSNNTSRYFEYYFGKYPHIIRKNRNGIAVLTGDETSKQLDSLADDVFLYYGLGCRNVSKIFVPKDYDFTPLLDVFASRKKVAENHKYFNNYEYNKAIYLVNSRPHFDSGNLLLVKDEGFASPVSVLNYEYYSNLQDVRNLIAVHQDKIQCVLTKAEIKGAFPLGMSQNPALWDYADGVDTLAFLQAL